MDDDLDFTDDEIRDELSKLGYRSIPRERLQEFKKGKIFNSSLQTNGWKLWYRVVVYEQLVSH